MIQTQLSSAVAQDANADEALEEVIVTGSHDLPGRVGYLKVTYER